MTHTYVVMELSPAAYAEITAKMKEAGYGYALDSETGAWDMHGIGVVESKDGPVLYDCNICGGRVDLSNPVKPTVHIGPGGKHK